MIRNISGRMPRMRTAMVGAFALLALISVGPANAASRSTPAKHDVPTASSSAATDAAASMPDYDPAAYAAALSSPDWVKTPDGLMYKSCVHALPPGAHIDGRSHAIVLANGSRQAPFKTCPHRRLIDAAPGSTPTAAGIRSAASPPMSSDGWFIASRWIAPDPVRGITSEYTVPGPPLVNGAENYFFSALEPADGSDILQPVLSYGGNAASGSGNFYYLNSWYLWGNNSIFSQTVRVNPGATVLAAITGNNCNSDGSGCYFTIEATNSQTGNSSDLSVTSDQVFYQVFGGVFESHYSPHCTYLPGTGSITFSNIKVFNNVGAQETPYFAKYQPDPECSMSEQITNTTTKIVWTD